MYCTVYWSLVILSTRVTRLRKNALMNPAIQIEAQETRRLTVMQVCAGFLREVFGLFFSSRPCDTQLQTKIPCASITIFQCTHESGERGRGQGHHEGGESGKKRRGGREQRGGGGGGGGGLYSRKSKGIRSTWNTRNTDPFRKRRRHQENTWSYFITHFYVYYNLLCGF